MDDPFERLLADLELDFTARKHSDLVSGTAKKKHEITPDAFAEITPALEPKRIAFVDGGNGSLDSAPDYLISLNRVYYTVFQGDQKIRPKSMGQGAEFLSCVVPHIGQTGYLDTKTPMWDIRIYPLDPKDAKTQHEEYPAGYLPRKSDLLRIRESTRILQESSPLASLARRLAEICLACRIISCELDRGDILVMDGSLDTSFDVVEHKYANELYDIAMEKGVIICGLSKTTRLITESGYPLLVRVSEISQNVPHGRWYVPIAEGLSKGGRGFTSAVRLHPNAKFVFRLDMLNEQFQGMTGSERDAVFGSLASNSSDMVSLGYPYGAIDVDKHAKIRTGDLEIRKRILYSKSRKNHTWQERSRHPNSIIFHDLLNRVTG